METILTKTCRKCGKEKPSYEFTARKRNIDGLYSYCKECKYNDDKIYRKNNPEKILAGVYKWQKNNPEKVKISKSKAFKKYYRKNHEAMLERAKIYRNNLSEEERARLDKKHSIRAISTLPNGYITAALCKEIKIKSKGIKLSTELIEAKRQNIFFKREIKKQKQLQTI